MDLKAIIKEQREELEQIERQERIIKRDLLERAGKYVKHPNILAVLGIRRCGKSIFSYLLAKGSSFGYINFDDERLANVQTSDLNKILQTFYELYGDVDFVILDELQNITGWELFANRLRRIKKVIITGSNSKLLSGELATHLTGRHIDLTLTPFSFKEFLSFQGFVLKDNVFTTKEKAAIRRLLDRYLEFGGFPEINKFGKSMLSGIYNDILTKDIILRHKIKKIEAIKKLSRYLISNFGQEFTYSKLCNLLNIESKNTMSKWVSLLEDAFLIFKIDRFSFKLKQQFIAPKKMYCQDNGLINVVAFRFSENIGRFMENSVAMELFRKKCFDPFLEIFYWKNHQQQEVDFLVKKGKKVDTLIQVSNISNEDEVAEREISSLLKASVDLHCNHLLVVTNDYQAERKIKGKVIKFIPLWLWLLSSKQ